MRAAFLTLSALPALLALPWPVQLSAQDRSTDSIAICELIQAHAQAWNRRDAHAAAAVYAPAADIRYSNGERLQGRSAIEAAHRAAFLEDTAGGGSRHSHPQASLWLRFVRPDLAFAEVEARYDYPIVSRGATPPPERSILFLVLTKERGHWSVLAQRNLGPVR